jgi:hypothetical protein
LKKARQSPEKYAAWRREELTRLGHPELAELPPTDEIIEKGFLAYTPAWSWVLIPLIGLVLCSIVLYSAWR